MQYFAWLDALKTILDTIRSAFESGNIKMQVGKPNTEIPDEVSNAMISLDTLFGSELINRAVEILSNGTIMEYRTVKSKRICFHVRGGKGVYHCIENFCSCPGFAFQKTDRFLFCKHLLASRLGSACKMTVVQEIQEEEFAKYAATNTFTQEKILPLEH